MDQLSLARIRTALIAVVAVFCGGMILIYAKSVVQPLLLAFFACLILNPLVKKIEGLLANRMKVPSRVSTGIALPAALLLAALLVLGLGLIFYANLTPIFREWPRFVERGTEQADRVLAFLRRMGVEKANWDTLNALAGDSNLAERIQQQFAPGPVLAFLTGGVTSFVSFFGQVFLVLVYMVFMLIEAADYREKAETVFGEKSVLLLTIEKVSQKIQVYLAVKTLMSFVTGALTALVCAVFGVSFPLFWGVFAFAVNYIPYLGSIVAVACPALLALFQYDNPLVAGGVLLGLAVVQNGIGMFLEPRVMGSRMSLSPVILLFSLMFWGWLWGIVGMILSAVFAATIQLAMHEHPYFRQWSRMMDAKASDVTRVLAGPPAPPAPAAGESAPPAGKPGPS
jgi:AI-2 transport protein TqsA